MCACACARAYEGWGVDLRCYLLVSEACLSCTASVMLFHCSFISSKIPFSALTAQFTDTALREVLLFGKHWCAQCCILSYFCQVPLNCGRDWIKKQSVALLQERRVDNYSVAASSYPATAHSFFSFKKRIKLFSCTRDTIFFFYSGKEEHKY